MTNQLLTPSDLELIWAEVVSFLDHYASRSPDYDHFRDWLSYLGSSFDLPGDRQVAGFLDVLGSRERVSVRVHRLDGENVDLDPVAVYRLKDVWAALTAPQLALY